MHFRWFSKCFRALPVGFQLRFQGFDALRSGQRLPRSTRAVRSSSIGLEIGAGTKKTMPRPPFGTQKGVHGQLFVLEWMSQERMSSMLSVPLTWELHINRMTLQGCPSCHLALNPMGTGSK